MRPCHLTPDLQQQIQQLLAACGSIKLACGAAGVPWSTAKDWLRKGRAGMAPYAEFVATCEQTKDMRASALHGVVADAARRDWKAAAWLLEREAAARKNQTEQLGGGEQATVLLYPVPAPLGSDPSQTIDLRPGEALLHNGRVCYPRDDRYGRDDLDDDDDE